MDRPRGINNKADGSTGLVPSTNPGPGPSGTLSPYPPDPQSIVSPAWLNSLGEEQRNLIIGLGDTPATDQVHQIADLFEQRPGPGITNMSVVRGVPLAEMNQQSGFFSRNGRQVSVIQSLVWSNTVAPFGDDLVLELPFGRAIGQELRGNVDPASDLQTDGGALQYILQGDLVDAFAAKVQALAGNANGSAGSVVTIGSIGSDGGPRILAYWVSYFTDGTRNPAWPYVQWDSPLDAQVFEDIKYSYNGAQPGDVIEILDINDVVVDTTSIGATPSDGDLSLDNPIGVVGNYRLRLRGALSHFNVVR